jgi:hypothetical protein
VETIAKDTCMSERHVYRALNRLKELNMVSVVGQKWHDVSVYLFHYDVLLSLISKAAKTPNALPHGHSAPDQQAVNPCQIVNTDLTNCHTNKVSEEGKEKGNGNVQTSDAIALLAGKQQKKVKPIGKDKKKTNGNLQSSTYENQNPPPIPPPPLPSAVDSKLVEAWKFAHADAGMPAPELSAEGCAQLSQLTKGEHALDYVHVRDHLIPDIVSHWAEFCSWVYTWYGVHQKSQAPMPQLPNVGFLLKYKVLASDYAEMSSEEKALSKEGTDLQGPVKFGALPKGIPKPKSSNTSVWQGHPTEK